MVASNCGNVAFQKKLNATSTVTIHQKVSMTKTPAKVITAGSIMTEPEVIIYDWQGPKVALHLLKTSKSDHGFLVTRRRNFLGLVTEKSLAELIKNKGQSTTEALEPDIATCTNDMLLEDLFAMAVATKYPIPVIDENGKLIGEIDNETILSSMVQYKETEAEKPKTGKKKKAAEESQSNV